MKRWSDTLDDATAAKPWILEEEKKDLLSKITDMNKWLEGKITEQAAKKLSEDPIFNGKEVESKFKPVQKLYKKTMGKKAPKVDKPKEEENKEDEKKDEEKKSEDKKDD